MFALIESILTLARTFTWLPRPMLEVLKYLYWWKLKQLRILSLCKVRWQKNMDFDDHRSRQEPKAYLNLPMCLCGSNPEVLYTSMEIKSNWSMNKNDGFRHLWQFLTYKQLPPISFCSDTWKLGTVSCIYYHQDVVLAATILASSQQYSGSVGH